MSQDDLRIMLLIKFTLCQKTSMAPQDHAYEVVTAGIVRNGIGREEEGTQILTFDCYIPKVTSCSVLSVAFKHAPE